MNLRERVSEVVKHNGFCQQMEILEHEPKLFIRKEVGYALSASFHQPCAIDQTFDTYLHTMLFTVQMQLHYIILKQKKQISLLLKEERHSIKAGVRLALKHDR